MNEKLSEKLYKAKIEWSKSDRLSTYLEEMRKPVLASEVIKARRQGEKTMNMCEHIAYASLEYKNHIEAMCDAKEETNKKYAYFQKVMQEIEEEKQKTIASHITAKYSKEYGN